MRLVDRSIVDPLTCLQIKLETLHKQAKREDRRKDRSSIVGNNQAELKPSGICTFAFFKE